MLLQHNWQHITMFMLTHILPHNLQFIILIKPLHARLKVEVDG